MSSIPRENIFYPSERRDMPGKRESSQIYEALGESEDLSSTAIVASVRAQIDSLNKKGKIYIYRGKKGSYDLAVGGEILSAKKTYPRALRSLLRKSSRRRERR